MGTAKVLWPKVFPLPLPRGGLPRGPAPARGQAPERGRWGRAAGPSPAVGGGRGGLARRRRRKIVVFILGYYLSRSRVARAGVRRDQITHAARHKHG